MQVSCHHSVRSHDSVWVHSLRVRPTANARILRLEEENPEETKRIEELKRQQRERQKALERQRKKEGPSPSHGPARDTRAT